MEADFNPKPAYRELDRLINQQWKTRLTLKTDAAGKAGFRGFHGQYTVAVITRDGKREFPVALRSGAGLSRATLKLP